VPPGLPAAAAQDQQTAADHTLLLLLWLRLPQTHQCYQYLLLPLLVPVVKFLPAAPGLCRNAAVLPLPAEQLQQCCHLPFLLVCSGPSSQTAAATGVELTTLC
jgi:hypothetical protein